MIKWRSPIWRDKISVSGYIIVKSNVLRWLYLVNSSILVSSLSLILYYLLWGYELLRIKLTVKIGRNSDSLPLILVSYLAMFIWLINLLIRYFSIRLASLSLACRVHSALRLWCLLIVYITVEVVISLLLSHLLVITALRVKNKRITKSISF